MTTASNSSWDLLDPTCSEPKYRQIVRSVKRLFNAGLVRSGQKMPSINAVCRQHGVSRDTVVKAFDQLVDERVLKSVHGVGYFAASRNAVYRERVLLLFDGLSTYKTEVHRGLLDVLEAKYEVSLYVHHGNAHYLESLLQVYAEDQEHVVIMPALDRDATRQAIAAAPVLQSLALYLLDRDVPGMTCPHVIQDFAVGTCQALESEAGAFQKYARLNLCCNEIEFIGRSIVRGARRFADKQRLELTLTPPLEIHEGVVYMVFTEQHIVDIIRKARAAKLRPGRDFGLIAYNDTPLLEIVDRGITAISVDFQEMGRCLGRMIRDQRKDHIVMPTRLIQRGSL